MRRMTFVGLILTAIAASAMTALSAARINAAPVAAHAPVVDHVYKVVNLGPAGASSETLTQAAVGGWRLVTVAARQGIATNTGNYLIDQIAIFEK